MSEPSKSPPEVPQENRVSLRGRVALIFGFIALVLGTISFSPDIAKQIAYSWNRGIERAKAEAAKQFLAENPDSGQRIAWVAKAAAPGVVGIQVISARPPGSVMAGGPLGTLQTEVGSGVIVDAEEGYIITNFHVIANAHAILVRLSDGREVDAEIVGRNRAYDLAVLRIEMDDLEALDWGDSQQVAVGEQVAALGSPFGLQQTVTSGIISATGRDSSTLVTRGMERRARSIPQEYLQTDAAINPGNSGGAIVDMNGKLIGICTIIISADSGGSSGIGFAIPSFTVKQIYEEIISYGEIKHGWIGISGLDEVTLSETRKMNQKKPMGAVIRYFTRESSPARDAGLQRGDIIVRWGETEITRPVHLIHLVTLTKPGTKETVEVFRDGKFLTLEITVGVRPTDW
jgi:S1-C subfamily serine protease